MFERFTDRARRAVVLAQEEARALEHNHVGPEHLLLGLIDLGEGVAFLALEALGVRGEAVKEQVAARSGQGGDPPGGHIPFTKPAKQALELSLREAIHMGHNYIGTEHLLLGLIRQGDTAAAEILVAAGVDLTTARQKVIELLHGHEARLRGREARRRTRLAVDPGEGMAAVLSRLETIERKLDLGPPPATLRDYNRRLAEVVRDKESAIEGADFQLAAELRDQEKRLLLERQAEEDRWLTGPGITAELEQAHAEIERLRGLLREHDVDPDGQPPASAAG